MRTNADRPATLIFIYCSCVLALILGGQIGWFSQRGGVYQIVFLLIAAATCVCSIGLAWHLAPEASNRWQDYFLNLLDKYPIFSIVAVLCFAVASPLITAYFVLDRFCNSGDEYAYLFQAWTFAHGKLWVEAPPLGYAFVPMRTWVFGNKWISQYPPGWSLLLSVALVIGFPLWALNAVLGGTFISTLLLVARQVGSSQVGLGIAGFCAVTPFYIFNAASYHSHVVVAFLITIVLFCGLRYLDKGHRSDAFLVGACVGYIGITRYYTAILVFIPFILWLFLKHRNSFYKGLLWTGLGGAPFLLALLFYHYALLDNPLKSTYSVMASEELFLSWDTTELLRAVARARQRMAELMRWTSPVLFLLYVCCLTMKIKMKSLAFYDLIFPFFILGFIFFANAGGNRYGPRYYFEAYPSLLLTIASATQPMMTWARKRSMQGIFVHVVLIGVIYSACAYPFAANEYYHITIERQDVYRRAKELNVHNAVVLINSATGVKWPMNVDDLARNGLSLSGDLLFARGDITNPREVQRAFPNRAVWVYERDPHRTRGRLYPVD